MHICMYQAGDGQFRSERPPGVVQEMGFPKIFIPKGVNSPLHSARHHIQHQGHWVFVSNNV